MSAGCLSNVCPSSSAPYKTIINESDHYNHTQNPIQKQGFLSILGTTTPDFNSLSSSSLISHPPPSPNYSIRRTFSAGMLALNQNGFSLKRAQSSEQLDFLVKHDDDDDLDHQEMNKNSSFSDEKRGAFEDIWSSIQKSGGSGAGSGDLPPPYVHPLVRRSASLLSQKSLEICTESLGSETGSETGLDGLSYPASDSAGSDKDGEAHAYQEPEEFTVIKINCAVVEDDHQEVGTTRFPSIRRASSSPPAVVPMSRSSFPPPLPSLSHRGGSNLHMRSHRRDGRLVLEAVAVPSVNRLRAQRHDGRLLLTLTADDDKGVDDEPTLDDDQDGESGDGEEQEALLDQDGPKKEGDDHEDEDQDGEEEEEEGDENDFEKELAIVMEAKTTSFKTNSSTSLIMSKLMELTSTKNKSAWPRNFNATIVKTLEDEATLAKSQLPPRPVRLVSAAAGTTGTATVLNAYEYYWRSGKGNTVAVLKPLAGQKNNTGAVHAGPQVVKDAYRNKLLLAHKGNSQEAGGEKEVVLVKADGVEMAKAGLKAEEYLVPLLRGCKETRKRSLLFWDSKPYCIATS